MGTSATARLLKHARTLYLTHRKRLWILIALALLVTAGTLILSTQYVLPFSFPHTIKELIALQTELKAYQSLHEASILAGFCTLYIGMQAVAIPGTLVLSVMSANLFGPFSGLVAITFCSTVGASLCYVFSWLCAGRLLAGVTTSARFQLFKSKLAASPSVFLTLLFFRVSPVLPNWFINITSPHLGISLRDFAGATFIGVIPAHILHVKAGQKLSQIAHIVDENQSVRSLFTYEDVLYLGAAALLVLAVAWLYRWGLARARASSVSDLEKPPVRSVLRGRHGKTK